MRHLCRSTDLRVERMLAHHIQHGIQLRCWSWSASWGPRRRGVSLWGLSRREACGLVHHAEIPLDVHGGSFSPSPQRYHSRPSPVVFYSGTLPVHYSSSAETVLGKYLYSLQLLSPFFCKFCVHWSFQTGRSYSGDPSSPPLPPPPRPPPCATVLPRGSGMLWGRGVLY